MVPGWYQYCVFGRWLSVVNQEVHRKVREGFPMPSRVTYRRFSPFKGDVASWALGILALRKKSITEV
jgi:hypothetical protein